MERKTIGAFIAVLRKAQGLTQRQLAEKLNVSDKTVSRWERDEGYPDLALIPILAEIFSVSCDELLRGERLPGERSEQDREKDERRSEKQRQYLLASAMSRFRNRSCIAALLALLGLTAAAAANFGFGRGRLGFFLGLSFLLVSASCQLILGNNARLWAGEAEGKALGAFRLRMLHITELCLGADLCMLAALLPLLSLEQADAAISAGSWLAAGGACAAGALALGCGVCWFINGRLSKRPEYAVEENAGERYRYNHRLKGRLGLALAVLLVFTGLAHLSLTRIWGPGAVMESTEFEDLNSFARFMEEKGMPLENNHYNDNARYYDEEGNEISFLEASRRYLTDENCKVFMEYVLNDLTVCSVQASFRGDELLELKAFACDYEQLEQARAMARRRNGFFAAVYVLELAAVTAVYFKKRAK